MDTTDRTPAASLLEPGPVQTPRADGGPRLRAPAPVAEADPRLRALAPLAEAGPRLRALVPVAGVTWSAFWRSRLLVIAAGAAAVLILGASVDAVAAFDPTRVSLRFGSVGNLLMASIVRWDSIWYLQIAAHGYASAQTAGFSPLLPILTRALSYLTGSLVVSGVLISSCACLAALEVVRRLTELELGVPSANRAVQLLAFGPMSLFLSAVYTDGLFLALSAGTVYAARRGRWRRAALLGALAGLARPAGMLVFAPVLVLFFYGPRADRVPAPRRAWWQPRYGFEPAILWSAAIPLVAAAFAGYLALHGLGLTGAVDAQKQYMHHRLTMPWVGAWRGLAAGWHELLLVLAGHHSPDDTSQALAEAASLIAVALATAGTFRRLPAAYGIYVCLALGVHLCSPTTGDPLKGFDRYASLRFPLFMWAASWSLERGISRGLIVAFGVLLVVLTSQFATWHVVGSLTL